MEILRSNWVNATIISCPFLIESGTFWGLKPHRRYEFLAYRYYTCICSIYNVIYTYNICIRIYIYIFIDIERSGIEISLQTPWLYCKFFCCGLSLWPGPAKHVARLVRWKSHVTLGSRLDPFCNWNGSGWMINTYYQKWWNSCTPEDERLEPEKVNPWKRRIILENHHFQVLC